MDAESLIQEQIDYYRRRAPEYDETSSPAGDPIAAFGEEIERVLHAFKPAGDVLEIASGTGTWTRLLVQHASSVTALDAAPEMHRESRRKLGDDPRVRYIEADVLSWEPDRSYDVVFFSNWLSHVPPALFEPFLGDRRASDFTPRACLSRRREQRRVAPRATGRNLRCRRDRADRRPPASGRHDVQCGQGLLGPGGPG